MKAYETDFPELNFDELNFEGVMDFMADCGEGLANMDRYIIFFGDEGIYDSRNCADTAGMGWNNCLFYFKDGDYVYVRKLFYLSKTVKNEEEKTEIVVYSFDENGNEIELYRGSTKDEKE